MSEDSVELEHHLEDYTEALLGSKDYPLAKEGVLLSYIDEETGEEDYKEDDPVICIALWSDDTYCIGRCQNNVSSVFWGLDEMGDPFGVVKVWLYHEEESFSSEWTPAMKPLYHSKQDGGSGWQTSEEQMSSDNPRGVDTETCEGIG
jgi:hypothetical protein